MIYLFFKKNEMTIEFFVFPVFLKRYCLIFLKQKSWRTLKNLFLMIEKKRREDKKERKKTVGVNVFFFVKRVVVKKGTKLKDLKKI